MKENCKKLKMKQMTSRLIEKCCPQNSQKSVHNTVQKVIPISEKIRDFRKVPRFLRYQINSKISENIKDFREILRFPRNFEIFQKFRDFRKVPRFSKSSEIFEKFRDFREFPRFSKNSNVCRKSMKTD